MTETVVVRRLSKTSLGITLPKRILKALRLKPGDYVVLMAVDGVLMVQKEKANGEGKSR